MFPKSPPPVDPAAGCPNENAGFGAVAAAGAPKVGAEVAGAAEPKRGLFAFAPGTTRIISRISLRPVVSARLGGEADSPKLNEGAEEVVG